MPYETKADLPKNIAENLPSHAQDIFKDAFNNALTQYGTEEQAFKVAWAAVKKKYEKNSDGKWVEKK